VVQDAVHILEVLECVLEDIPKFSTCRYKVINSQNLHKTCVLFHLMAVLKEIKKNPKMHIHLVTSLAIMRHTQMSS
jgi:hypothetical protein